MRSVDFGYLETFLGGDLAVVREVLTLFHDQAETWRAGLVETNPDWRTVAHTIKGAGRGVGARALGDACETAERVGEAGLPAVHTALDTAVEDIVAYLAEAAEA